MIGIFDSGIGGLSVFKEIIKLLPSENYIYYSDNAHCPYGNKSNEYIIDRARYITTLLIEKGAEIIVIACNTATSAAIKTLREEFDLPFVGMEPAVKPASFATKTGVVGVLATEGTLKGEKYHHSCDEYAKGVKIVEHIGEGFVELVEKGILTGDIAEDCIRKSIDPIIGEGADIIVLGCTHYPFLKEAITKLAGDKIQIIDPSPAVARRVLELRNQNKTDIKNNIEASTSLNIILLSSGDDSSLKRCFKSLAI